MTTQQLAQKLYEIYQNQGEIAFENEFKKLQNTFVYSDGLKKGQPVEKNYLIQILDEVKKLENPDSLYSKRKAISQLALLIKSIQEALTNNNSQNSK